MTVCPVSALFHCMIKMDFYKEFLKSERLGLFATYFVKWLFKKKHMTFSKTVRNITRFGAFPITWAGDASSKGTMPWWILDPVIGLSPESVTWSTSDQAIFLTTVFNTFFSVHWRNVYWKWPICIQTCKHIVNQNLDILYILARCPKGHRLRF